MSKHFSWQSAVLESDCESTTKFVLLVVGTYMNQHGSGAFPSYNTIAQAASLGRSTVIKHIDIASEKGWILKTVRPKGNQDNETNLYGISFPLPSPAGGLGVVHQEYHLVHTVDHPSPFGGPPLVHVVDPNTPVLTPQRTPQTHRELPDWIPHGTWQAFEEMRRKIKKPITDLAFAKLVEKLKVMREEGQDVVEVLEQSIISCWAGVFPLRKMVAEQKGEKLREAPWWSSNEAMLKKGREIGLQPRSGESWNDFKGRIDGKLGGAA